MKYKKGDRYKRMGVSCPGLFDTGDTLEVVEDCDNTLQTSLFNVTKDRLIGRCWGINNSKWWRKL